MDTDAPHSARVWDYWLGGKDNYAVDRAVAERILTVVPRQRRHVRANRAFLTRAVRHLVTEAGIRQIVDVGSGLPTQPTAHQVAHASAPDVRVLYVDNDPLVLAHSRALLPTTAHGAAARIAVVEADLRDPDGLHAALRECPLFDPDAPTAVLLLAMLMSLTDEDGPAEVLDALVAPLPVGSHVAITHTTADFDPPGMRGYVAAAHEAGMTFTPRTREEVERFFEKLDLLPPGVVPVSAWHPDMRPPRDPRGVSIYAGVGRKP